jgi:hypothetical protein
MCLYAGPTAGLAGWFERGLGYGPWSADCHGSVADWVIDLVNVGFTKPRVRPGRGPFGGAPGQEGGGGGG